MFRGNPFVYRQLPFEMRCKTGPLPQNRAAAGLTSFRNAWKAAWKKHLGRPAQMIPSDTGRPLWKE